MISTLVPGGGRGFRHSLHCSSQSAVTCLRPFVKFFNLLLVWGLAIALACSAQTAISQTGISGRQESDQVATKEKSKHTYAGEGWEMHITVSPSKPSLSDRIQLLVEIQTDPRLVLQPPECLIFPGELELVHSTTPYTVVEETGRQSQGRQVSRFAYELTPMAIGEQRLPQIAVPYKLRDSGDTLAGVISNPDTTIVVSTSIEARRSDLKSIATSPEPKAIKTGWLQESGLAIVAGVLTVGLIAICFFCLRRKGKTERQNQSSEVLALKEINELESDVQSMSSTASNDHSKTYVSRVTSIVRRYVESKTGIIAPELTTAEFVDAMRTDNRISADVQQTLRQFLEAADLVKFAGQKYEQENILATLSTARQLIQAQHWSGLEMTRSEADRTSSTSTSGYTSRLAERRKA